MRSKKITGWVLLLPVLMLASGAVRAVELKPEPIQSQMRASLAVASLTPGPQVLAGVYDVDKDEKESEDPAYGRKSGAQAALYSILLPGAGQYYCGQRKTARYFFAAEAASWLGYIAFRTYGGWKKDDYIQYGLEHAGAQLEDKDDEFIDYVSFYDNIDQYNEYGRAIDRDRPYFAKTAAHYWSWDSDDKKNAFRDLKNRSREAYRRSDFMIGAMILNRIVSAIHAVRIAGKTGKRLDDLASLDNPSRIDYKVEVNPFSDHIQLGLTLHTRF